MDYKYRGIAISAKKQFEWWSGRANKIQLLLPEYIHRCAEWNEIHLT